MGAQRKGHKCMNQIKLLSLKPNPDIDYMCEGNHHVHLMLKVVQQTVS